MNCQFKRLSKPKLTKFCPTFDQSITLFSSINRTGQNTGQSKTGQLTDKLVKILVNQSLSIKERLTSLTIVQFWWCPND